MSSIITESPPGRVVDKEGWPLPWWTGWFKGVYVTCFSVQDSGVTANRPVTNLWVGRRYFDTTLGKPVWLKSVGPNVWVDATGVAV